MSRYLTIGEITVAKLMFKDSVDYTLVKVHDEKYAFFQPNNSGMTPDGEIYVNGIYSNDFSKETGVLRAFFIHEMVHVWQYQNTVLNVKLSAIWEMITEGFNYNNAYKYTLDVNKDLLDYDIEQQASIIEDFYRITVERMMYRKSRVQNKESGLKLINLYQAVLKNFVKDPKYARHK